MYASIVLNVALWEVKGNVKQLSELQTPTIRPCPSLQPAA